ncbi:MAG TPA: DinB family protein [Ferruginibacter sp.]|nr:DinB family protein [Ferruginibacter sp.]
MLPLKDELKQTQSALIAVVSSIPDDKIDVVPFEGSWTAGQVLEHLCKSVSTRILKGNVQTVSRPADEKIAFVRSIFLDFTKKYSAPDFILPLDATHNKQEQLLLLTGKFDRLIAALDSYNLAEECTDLTLPGFGNFTRLEWIAFQMLHTKRHTEQLRNIAAALNSLT